MKADKKKAYIELHIAVLLFGFTAILGKLITLPAISIVWWRVLITTLSLLFLAKVPQLLKAMSRRQLGIFFVIGCIVALHWLTFYGSIKLANASIALICMATASLFTSFIEPILLKSKFKLYELLLGVAVIPGMILIVHASPSEHHIGIVVGLISAFLAALFGALNKKHLKDHNPVQVTFIEMGSSTIFLTVGLALLFSIGDTPEFIPDFMDVIYLIVLALLCTTLAFVLTLRALRHISAFATALSINLEPVYGIILAWLILHEHQELSPCFYLGVLIILGCVFSYPFLNKRYGHPEV